MDVPIYEPAEDSYFFEEFLTTYLGNFKGKHIEYLDMGTGSGILCEAAAPFVGKENILAVDINPLAVQLVREKGFTSIKGSLFSKVDGDFDIITFNAPYLPEDPREPADSRIATTGGIKGDEISIEFVNEARNHLKKEGVILLLISSLTPLKKLENLGGEIVARKKLEFEELLILRFS